MERIKFILFVSSLMIILNISGCVPVIYHQYEPIDVIDIYYNPIPQREIDFTGGLYVQNPGYQS